MKKMTEHPSSDWLVGAAVMVGCMAVTLGLWLPSRWAVWPLRVLAALMSIAMVMVFKDACPDGSSMSWNDGWDGVWQIIRSTWGIVLFGFSGMWFALTGKIGWREDQRPIIV